MNLDPALLEILVCPRCRTTLFVDTDAAELVCNDCSLAYPVRDDIPVMLVEESTNLDADAAARLDAIVEQESIPPTFEA